VAIVEGIEPVSGLISAEQTFAMFAKLSKDIRKLVLTMNDNGIDVDEWESCQSFPQSVYQLKPAFDCPIVVDFVLCSFPVTSTAVQLQLGTRYIPINNLASGMFIADLRMQLEYEDPRIMTVTPAGIGHFEIMGHCAQRVQDRP
jgi:hypothetical protein